MPEGHFFSNKNNGEVKPEFEDAEAFKVGSKKIVRLLKENPVSSLFTKYGTVAMVDICQALKVLPTRNFTHGVMKGAEKINAQTMHDLIKLRGGEEQTQHACMHQCAIQCSNKFPDKDGKRLCSPVEYETMALMGSNLCLKDLESYGTGRAFLELFFCPISGEVVLE